MKPPTNGPIYAALYAELATLFRSCGYALAIHGSLARDFDLVAIPWAKTITSREEVLQKMTSEFALKITKGPTEMNHGRLAYSVNISHGTCYIDLSFVLIESGSDELTTNE